jgi:hypothetical protein
VTRPSLEDLDIWRGLIAAAREASARPSPQAAAHLRRMGAKAFKAVIPAGRADWQAFYHLQQAAAHYVPALHADDLVRRCEAAERLLEAAYPLARD